MAQYARTVGDINGDGKADLFYTSPDADAVLVRLQQDGSSFGEEWRLEIPKSRCWTHPVHLGKETGLAWIHSATSMVEVSGLISPEMLVEIEAEAVITSQ